VHVAGDDPQLVVAGSGDGGALHHLGQLADGRFESFQVVLGRKAQLDRAVDLEPQAQTLAVQDGHATLDDPRVLQPLDAPPARRRGQSDRIGDLGDGQSGVVLDEVEDLGIHSVESLRQLCLRATPRLHIVLAPEPLAGGMLLASNCGGLI